jgi:hypothetical protein
MNGFFGGLAQGQQYREQQDIRDAENTRRQQEFDQMSRMRDYQMNEMQREKDLNDKLAGISEYESPAPDAAPDAPKIRRPDRHITFDRADVLAQYGGPKYLGMAQQLRSGQYDLDRKKTEAMLSEIASMSGTEEEKIAALAKGVSNNTAIPGKMEVRTAPSPDGKGFIVSSTNAKGEALPAYSVSSFDDLHRRIISGLSPENYFRAHADQRDSEKAQREADQHGPTMRALNVAAEVAEGTKGSKIAAGELSNKKIQAEIDQLKAYAAYLNRRDGSLGRGGSGGAGGAGRDKVVSIKTTDGNGAPIDLKIRWGLDKDGKPTATTLDGKPITDPVMLGKITGQASEEIAAEMEADSDLAAVYKSKDVTPERLDEARAYVGKRLENKLAKIRFDRSPEVFQKALLDRMVAENQPDEKFAALGLSEKQIDKTRKSYNTTVRNMNSASRALAIDETNIAPSPPPPPPGFRGNVGFYSRGNQAIPTK